MITISGDQFVESGEIRSYSVSGIPTAWTLVGLEMPNGWTINSTGSISGGIQDFDLNIAIGSGTLVATYTDGTYTRFGTLDVYSSATRMGEEITRSGVIIPSVDPVIPVAFCEDNSECIFPLPVLADPDDPNNKLTNDKSEFYFYGNAAISSIAMTIQKATNGIFSDIVTLIDGSYGQFFAYGNSPDFLLNPFTDDYGKKYTGIFLDWLLVYNDFGAGNYRMKIQQTDIFSGVTTSYSGSKYCLKKYNCHFTEGTIRIETLNQGWRGTLNDLTNQIYYPSHPYGWNGMIRLKGKFKQLEPGYNKEYNEYGDGDNNAYKPIIDEQVPKYKLQIKPVPGWLDWYISTNVLQADRILITDYNSKSRHSFIQVPVKDGVLKLVNEEYKNPLAVIEIEFALGQNNLRRRNS